MVDVVIQAFEGGLQGTLSLRVVATLMAAEGIEHGAPERFAGAMELLERLVSSGSLRVRVERRMAPIPGQHRYFRDFDRDRDSPLDADKVDPETRRAGQWMVSSSAVPGSVPCQREVREEFITPGAMADLLEGSVGEGVKALGFRSKALDAWLLTTGGVKPTKMRRVDIERDWEFVTKRGGDSRSFAESWKKVLAAGLKKDDDKLFDPEVAGRIAGGLRPPLMLLKKGSAETPAGRAGAAADGTLTSAPWFPPP